MGKDSYLIFLAILVWAIGYFVPDVGGKPPVTFLNTYILLPKWLNGFLRKKHSNQIPDGVISVSALGAQLSAPLLILMFIGFNLNFTFLDSFLFSVSFVQPVSKVL